MRVVVDNQSLSASPSSIAEALSVARLNAEQRGRVVIEATLDGQPLNDAQLSDPPNTPCTGGELRFVTAEPAELVGSTLAGVADSLADLKADQAAAADLVTVGNLGEAMDRLHHALRAWETVRQAVTDGTNLLGLSVETLRVQTSSGERAMSEQIKQLSQALGEVKRAFGAEDWAGLADLLGYDLQEQADQWRECLSGLADLVRTTPPAPKR